MRPRFPACLHCAPAAPGFRLWCLLSLPGPGHLLICNLEGSDASVAASSCLLTFAGQQGFGPGPSATNEPAAAPAPAAAVLLRRRWLRREKEERQSRHEEEAAQVEGARGGDDMHAVTWNSGWAPGRLTASIKLSSNTVLRM